MRNYVMRLSLLRLLVAPSMTLHTQSPGALNLEAPDVVPLWN